MIFRHCFDISCALLASWLFKLRCFKPAVFPSPPAKATSNGFLMSPLKGSKVHAITALSLRLMVLSVQRCGTWASHIIPGKPRVHQELELGLFGFLKTFLFDRLDNNRPFYESAMSFTLPVYCSQITNRFDPNSVGVTALVECITQVKINPQAQREAFFLTPSEKQGSV